MGCTNVGFRIHKRRFWSKSRDSYDKPTFSHIKTDVCALTKSEKKIETTGLVSWMRWSYTCLIVVAIEFIQYVLALNTMSTVRCCSRCRCPGHTAKKCNVFKPTGLRYYEPSGPGDLERQREYVAVREINRIREQTAKPAMTYYECINAWIARGNDPSRLREGRVRHAALMHETQLAAIQEATQALERRSTAAEEVLHGLLPGVQLLSPWRLTPLPAEPQRTPTPTPVVNQTRDSAEVVEPPKIQVREAAVEETTCAICAENLTDCDKYVTPCGHQFHGSCAMKWIQRSKLCATCREPVIA
ncbi:MAG: hypothetical protein CMG60_08020 [Candidatus Marinimicrobia bacterium]|nr:hypothetical protein [Candidatus Neomarinimicrobiota bacterium]